MSSGKMKIIKLDGRTPLSLVPNDAYDTSETVYLSAVAISKIMRHAQQGIPLEVMGLLVGEFVDEYKINVYDVFWMRQQATGISVESIDPVFQSQMMEMLKAGGRKDNVVGWYHSHPGFGCWLSATDVQTAREFEMENSRAVSVVVDSVQSVRGKINIEAFRTIGSSVGPAVFSNVETRQTTSNECIQSSKTSYGSLIGSGGKSYYTINIAYAPNPFDRKVLSMLTTPDWKEVLIPKENGEVVVQSENDVSELIKIVDLYRKNIEEETKADLEEITRPKVGQVDPKQAFEKYTEELMHKNFKQNLSSVMNYMSILSKRMEKI